QNRVDRDLDRCTNGCNWHAVDREPMLCISEFSCRESDRGRIRIVSGLCIRYAAPKACTSSATGAKTASICLTGRYAVSACASTHNRASRPRLIISCCCFRERLDSTPITAAVKSPEATCVWWPHL